MTYFINLKNFRYKIMLRLITIYRFFPLRTLFNVRRIPFSFRIFLWPRSEVLRMLRKRLHCAVVVIQYTKHESVSNGSRNLASHETGEYVEAENTKFRTQREIKRETHLSFKGLDHCKILKKSFISHLVI